VSRTLDSRRLPIGLAIVALAGGALPGIAGQVALYLWLGLFPGMFVASLIARRTTRLTRWTLGLALAPLVAASAGWALMSAGLGLATTARAVALAGWLGWMLFEPREPDAQAAADEAQPSRFLFFAVLAAALAIAVPLFARPWLRIHWDGWLHQGLVWELYTRGIPPQDPRFAGLPLNYVWFYNLFLAMLLGLRERDPFVFMAIFNVATMIATMLVTWQLGFALWRERRAAAGSVALLAVGFNAGAWLLWPLGLVSAFRGSVRGLAEVRRVAGRVTLNTDHVIYSLSAPFAHMASFLDKYLLGTSLGYAYLLLMLYLWAMLRWLRDGRRDALLWAALAIAGMLLFHVVVGLSVVPVSMVALVLGALAQRRWRWLPSSARFAIFAAVTAVAALAVYPYVHSIMSGWTPEKSGLKIQYLRLNVVMPWTLLTSCGVAAWFAWRPLRDSLAEQRGEVAAMALWLVCMTGFAAVVHLAGNNEVKFAFQVFVPLAILGGAVFLPVLSGWIERWGRVRAVVVIALLFAFTPEMTLFGYMADASGRTAPALNPAPGEERLYEWIRAATPLDAVFVDNRDRDLIMVKGRRRMLVGTTFGPDLAAFPVSQMTERRAVEADLYGPAADLDHDIAVLARLDRPTFVLYRATDFAPHAQPWWALERRRDRFQIAYDAHGFRVYRLTGAETAAR